ncbi:MAG: hypothetical protein RI963_3704, partial [Planctomycetota bacterium]
MARAGLTTKYTNDTKLGKGSLGPRNDTEDHGIGRVIGARRMTTKYTNDTKGG